MTKTILRLFLLLSIAGGQVFVPPAARASSGSAPPADAPWYRKLEAQWGGHLKLRGSAARPAGDSFYRPVGIRTYYDGNLEARLKGGLYVGDRLYLDAHYEAVLAGGDSRRKAQDLQDLYGGNSGISRLTGASLEDDRRLLDLTGSLEQNRDYILYHRLDRLSVTWMADWGAIRAGRQAITWGNGLLFNPMDLFNPFSPADIERDYKVGDDMLSGRFAFADAGDLQLLYVPRREPDSRDLRWDQSSLAAKLHFAAGTTEFDLLAGRHYEDTVLGAGAAGYWGSAAWRCDFTSTFLKDGADRDQYFSLAANMDYSWVWWGRNFYGFLEFFYSGLGNDDYSAAAADRNLAERLARGELFTLGRAYFAGHLQVELHPLLNAYVTVINNAADPSGILQPRLVWDVTQNTQLIFGGALFYGAKGTEFGGFKIAGLEGGTQAPDSAFLWFSYFF